ncbi:MAG TPA: hypothetical protein DHV28_12455 [Ignavibacteriales bacterium]|nr:hypothetical protein [Ignavibacteriales bacterium]
MIKYMFLLFISLLLFVSCNDSSNVKEKVNNPEAMALDTYKPGFGEFMTNVQIHHAKLWFAGKYQNWALADFELNEISETIDAIKKYQQERPETKVLSILNPAMDSVRVSIRQQDQKLFVKSFTDLTNTCNACHQSVKFGFNVVKIPDTPPFSNQDFSVKQKAAR